MRTMVEDLEQMLRGSSTKFDELFLDNGAQRVCVIASEDWINILCDESVFEREEWD